MAYRIFLTDGIDTAEMDTENIDTKTIFALLELQDIGSKKNDIETLTFKGTKNNNEAFGSFFDFSRESNVSFSNNLFFNYNPLKSVKTFVYEDTELIFVGDLRLTEINVDVNGVVIYNCVVATKLTLLKTALSDKYLADLDFTDLRHRYCGNNIINSWVTSGGTFIETFDDVTDTYSSSYKPYGTGYNYPLIDYGYTLSAASATFSGLTIQKQFIHNLKNFKPAVYVRQYLDSIFNQEVLTGYTYEIKGSSGFTNMFNKIIIPDTNDNTLDTVTGITTLNYITANQEFFVLRGVPPYNESYWYNPTNSTATLRPASDLIIQPSSGIDNYLLSSDGKARVQRDFTSSVKFSTAIEVDCRISSDIINSANTIATISLVRFSSTDINVVDDIIYSEVRICPYNDITTIVITDEIIDNVEFRTGQWIGIFIELYTPLIFGGPFNPIINFVTVFGTDINIPATSANTFNYIATPQLVCDEEIIEPKKPKNIKQLDFLKSIINQFNFVVYTEKDNYKHFIFELYDDYYSKMVPQNLITNSLDWTTKIDYTKGLQITPNIKLPKSYLYTYKSDIDFLNATYKTKYNEIYGQFSFNDDLGLVEQKKVELIFAPTVMTTINSYNYPLYYKVENGVISRTALIPRIIYYNGYNTYENLSSQLFVGYEANSTPGITIIKQLIQYPLVSNYYYNYDNIFAPTYGKPINDIHFNQPREIYFQNTNDIFSNLPNSYTNYYINQVTELTDENVIFVDCDVYLTEFDIGNLDLSVPVFIQTGNNNGAYFKIINVEYENKDLPSRVKLQKIVI
jgi:hypothetical protein